jgi:hypothetical protein
VLSVAALARSWRAVAALTFGLAVAVKFLPIVLVPLYWKRVRIRDAVLAAVVIALLYVPFLYHGHIPTGSIGTYVRSFRFNGPVFAILHHVAPPQVLAGLALLVGLVTATWLRNKSATRVGTALPAVQQLLTAEYAEPSQRSQSKTHSGFQSDAFTWDIFAWPMAASLFCAPVVFPWYLLWLLPFLTSRSTLLITIWSVSIIPTYVMWHLRALGRSWGALPVWVMLVEYGWIAVAGAIIWLRRIKPA